MLSCKFVYPKTLVLNQITVRFLLELGGGGRIGTALPEAAVLVAVVEPRRLEFGLSDCGFLRPGMAMLNVWPSFRL